MRKIALLALCCIFLTGCGGQASPEASAPETTETTTPSEAETPSPTETTPETTLAETDAPETAVSETDTAETAVSDTSAEAAVLTVYSSDETGESFVTTDVEVTAVNESTIVEQLILAGVLTESVAVNSLESDDGQSQLHADFNSAFSDYLLTMGTTGEYMLLGSVVNTFLTAYSAETILITVDGQPLETGHNVYDQPLSLFE